MNILIYNMYNIHLFIW